MGKPKYLYKYCSAQRAAQILRDGYVYLCPPKDLNDLFEGSLGRLLKFRNDVALELQCKNLMFHTDWSRDETLEFIEKSISEESIRKNFDFMVDNIRQLNESLREHSGITCFSEIRDDQRMWGTYGDNHGGVCIEFWSQGNKSVIHDRAFPVIYSNERVDDRLSELFNDDCSLNVNALLYYCYLRKTLDWRDEREWRVLILANEEQTTESRKLFFASSNIRRIFLGPRISGADRDNIHEISRAKNADWGIYDLLPKSDEGAIAFEGFEVVKSFEDIKYWLPKTQQKDEEV
jgi:hypothetical protein